MRRSSPSSPGSSRSDKRLACRPRRDKRAACRYERTVFLAIASIRQIEYNRSHRWVRLRVRLGEVVMALGSVSDFVDLLRKNRLLKPSQMDELVRLLQPRYSDTAGLAKELVRRGWLTVYQINQLF